jgi:hypothetical protein
VESEGEEMSRGRLITLVVLGLVAAIQLVPVDLYNPPLDTRAEISAPLAVKGIIKTACYNCHSYRTNWPWYAMFAPLSWKIEQDVQMGREHLNFSIWSQYGQVKRRNLRSEILEEVEAGAMPPWFYLPLHPLARLSEEEVDEIRKWVEAEESN